MPSPLLVNFIFKLVILKFALVVTLDNDIVNVDVVLDTTLLTDALNFIIDLGLAINVGGSDDFVFFRGFNLSRCRCRSLRRPSNVSPLKVIRREELCSEDLSSKR